MILVARIRIISFIKEENREKVPLIKEENGVFETNSLGKCDELDENSLGKCDDYIKNSLRKCDKYG